MTPTHPDHTHHGPANGPAGVLDLAECPVMPGTVVDRAEAEAADLVRDHRGTRYHLCCPTCARLFDADPDRYTSTDRPRGRAQDCAGTTGAGHAHATPSPTDHVRGDHTRGDHGRRGQAGHRHGGHAHGDDEESEHPGDPGHASHPAHAPDGSGNSHSGHGRRGHMDRRGHADHTDPAHTAHAHGGPHTHDGHAAQFRTLFWAMLVLAVPVVAFNDMFASMLGYDLPSSPWVAWVSPAGGTVLYLVGGRPFLTGAASEIRARRPGMMLLVALAITVAFAASWGASLGLLDHQLNFWWELALLVVVMLLGHWIEMRSLARTSSALDSLAALLPDSAERVEGETTVAVAPSDLVVGDVVLVRPGATVPADGRVLEGTAHVEESMITGESTPVRRKVGDRVVAGTVATDSALRVQVTATGDATALAGIAWLVARAQASSSHSQRLADRAAGWLFWFALGAAALTAVVWVAVGRPDDAVVRAVTVLAIACPHALGLAIPLVVSVSTERAARAGVLVTDRLALETMREVDVVVFDKTGTLTRGQPAVTGVEANGGHTVGQVLAWAAAVESDSEHPLARAVVAAARERDLAVPRASGFTSTPGVGVGAQVSAASDGAARRGEDVEPPDGHGAAHPGPTDGHGAAHPGPAAGHLVEVGGPRLLASRDLAELPVAGAWGAQGAGVLHVLVDGQVAGALRVADAIRPESREAVDALHAAGTEVVMATGDSRAVAQAVAAELGIDRVLAQVRPEDKAAAVADLQAAGRTVAVVGDGVNDAPALAAADVGIAIGAGTDVAIASAGVILAGSDPRGVLSVVELSRAAHRKMTQNLWWAAGYNLVSVPLAAGVLAPLGFVLPMSVGAVLMSLSTVVVALNAQLLRRLDLSPAAAVRAVRARHG